MYLLGLKNSVADVLSRQLSGVGEPDEGGVEDSVSVLYTLLDPVDFSSFED